MDYKNSWNHWKNPYGEANGFNVDDDKVVNNFPAMWSNLHLGSDGVVYYDCPNCGAKAYYVDFVQYGYYDKNLNVCYTGYSGYQFCPTCNKGDEANTGKRGVKVGNTTIFQQVGSYEGPASSANSFQGIYTYPEIKNEYGKYLITTDPAYAGLGYTTPYASWMQMP